MQYHVAALIEKATDKDLLEDDIILKNDSLKHMFNSEDYIFDHIYFVSLEGKSYRMSGEFGDVKDRSYYRAHLGEDLSYFIGEPVMGQFLKAPVCHLSVPIADNQGKLAGVLVGALSLERLIKDMENDFITAGSYGWIVDAKGTYIAHPDYDFEAAVNMAQVEGENLIVLEDSEISQGEVGWIDSPDKGIAFARISFSPGWTLGIVYETGQVFASRNKLYITIGAIALALIILVVIVTSFLTSNITRPIELLTQAALRKEELQGQLTRIQDSHEMGLLIGAYNEMHHSIARHTLTLEETVQQRTEELRLANEALFKLATRDPLTGVFNREQLDTEMEAMMIASDQGSLEGFAVLFMDLNNFKYFNDNFGHHVGDQLLIQVAKLLVSALSSEDIIFRYGGDEFVSLVYESDLGRVQKICRRIEQTLCDQYSYKALIRTWADQDEIVVPSHKSLGLSIGYALYHKGCEKSMDQVLHEADQAMYVVKAASKRKL